MLWQLRSQKVLEMRAKICVQQLKTKTKKNEEDESMQKTGVVKWEHGKLRPQTNAFEGKCKCKWDKLVYVHLQGCCRLLRESNHKGSVARRKRDGVNYADVEGK